MRQTLSLACVALLVIPVWGQDRDASTQGAKFLQGEWIVVGIEDGGLKATPEELEGMRWSIKGNVITATQPGAAGRMLYKLNPEARPREIDITSLDEGPLQGQTDPGIYEFKDGRLRICYRDPDNKKGGRPKSFLDAAPQGSGYGIIILERAKN